MSASPHENSQHLKKVSRLREQRLREQRLCERRLCDVMTTHWVPRTLKCESFFTVLSTQCRSCGVKCDSGFQKRGNGRRQDKKRWGSPAGSSRCLGGRGTESFVGPCCRTLTWVGSMSGPAVVGIGSGRLLHLRHGPPLLLPHLYLRLGGPGGHVGHVPLLALRAVPVGPPLPVLDGLFPETPVPRRAAAAASGGALVTGLAQTALHVVELRLAVLLHGMHLHAVAVVTSGALRDGLDSARGSGQDKSGPWLKVDQNTHGPTNLMFPLFLFTSLFFSQFLMIWNRCVDATPLCLHKQEKC